MKLAVPRFRNTKGMSSMTLDELSRKITDLKREALANVEDAGLCVIAEQHFLLALDALGTAAANAELACIHQVQAIAAMQMKGH
jgi:hypothetical protein